VVGRKAKTTTVELELEPAAERATAREHGTQPPSRNIAVLGRASRLLRDARDPADALSGVLELLCASIQASHGYFLQADPASGKLRARATYQQEEADAERAISRTIVQRVLQTGQPLLTTDATLDGRLRLSESIILKNIRSVLCVPFQAGEKSGGLLYLHGEEEEHALAAEDLELAAAVGLQVSMALSMMALRERLDRSEAAAVGGLVAALEIADPNNQGHASRVADSSAAVAAELGLSPAEVAKVRLGALLHDVGKLAVRGSEGAQDQHVYAGEKIAGVLERHEEILPAVRYHHERANGSGFPYRIKNDQIPIPARIVIVTNAFDNACTRGGLGGLGLPTKDVLKDMARRGGTEFDDDVIKALLLCHRKGTLYGAPTPPSG
jgi:putative nucleotidyltransferase with HDIG domain